MEQNELPNDTQVVVTLGELRQLVDISDFSERQAILLEILEQVALEAGGDDEPASLTVHQSDEVQAALDQAHEAERLAKAAAKVLQDTEADLGQEGTWFLELQSPYASQTRVLGPFVGDKGSAIDAAEKEAGAGERIVAITNRAG